MQVDAVLSLGPPYYLWQVDALRTKFARHADVRGGKPAVEVEVEVEVGVEVEVRVRVESANPHPNLNPHPHPNPHPDHVNRRWRSGLG
mgnify:CR=1 FL=1